MPWVDVHCHLDSFSKPEAVVERASEAGVEYIISNSDTIASIVYNANLGARFPSVFYCAGIHPTRVDEWVNYESRSILEKIDKHDGNLVAVGEVGLDWKHATTDSDKLFQEDVLRKMLEMSVKENLPVVIHSRDAVDYTLQILSDYKLKDVLLHWFTGAEESYMKRAMDEGYYVSVDPRALTSKRIQRNVSLLDLDRLLLETDGPIRYGGKSAEPSWIPRVGAKVAEVFGKKVSVIEDATFANSLKLFGLKAKA